MGGETYNRNVEVNIDQFIDDTEENVGGDFGRSDEMMGGEAGNVGNNGGFDRDITEFLFNEAVSEESPLGSTEELMTEMTTDLQTKSTTESTRESTTESTTVESTTGWFFEMSFFLGKTRSFRGIFGSKYGILGRFWVKICDFRSFWV